MAQIKAKLIDVSDHQGKIDWEKVKPHIDGAILRCGYGMDLAEQDDGQYRRNAEACTRLGIPFGVYLYSYADSPERAESEARHALRLVKDYSLSYPVYLDLEENGTQSGAVQRANIFGDKIEKAGYWCGIYANLNWWNNHLKGLDRFTKWVAQYDTRCQYEGKHLDIWQYSSQGSLPGISGNVDLNKCYRDLPGEIRGTGEKGKTTQKSVSVLAEEVLAGQWGNGAQRKSRLTDAGYDYEAVQNAVNSKLETIPVQYHTVRAGETLSQIASRYGTTWTALARNNDIPDPDLIYAGQRLRVR